MGGDYLAMQKDWVNAPLQIGRPLSLSPTYLSLSHLSLSLSHSQMFIIHIILTSDAVALISADVEAECVVALVWLVVDFILASQVQVTHVVSTGTL